MLIAAGLLKFNMAAKEASIYFRKLKDDEYYVFMLVLDWDINTTKQSSMACVCNG